eukprot:GILI01000374.1.p1 GENE.GILI01000374.1~~GILI01000374.1.p1  ORF type:complete len:174 (+),score=27.55 GILI01000374.1:76-522(+)
MGKVIANSNTSPTPPMQSPLPEALKMPCTPPMAPHESIPLAFYDLSYVTEVDTSIVGSYRGIEPYATYRAPTAVPASFVPPRGMIPTGIYSKFSFKGKFTMTHPSRNYGETPSKEAWSNIPDNHNNRAIAQSAPQTLVHSRDDICLHY